VVELISLSAGEAAQRIARGALTSESLVRAHLERISQRDDSIRAWAYLAPETALAQARARDRGPHLGPLHGVPVGIKDLMDTFDMPTGYGSPIHEGHRPLADAVPVAMLRAAGAIILGKTVTTEFAFRHPGPTRNPRDPTRTPGGSSSGSAAAVADFQVPVATGTQTGGSVIRPAAYCGCVGFKPSFGDISTQGTKTMAWSLDTVGMFARTVGDIALMRAAMIGIAPAKADPSRVRSIRLGLCRTEDWDQAQIAQRALVETTARRLEAAGAIVRDVDLPSAAREPQRIHRTIIHCEMRAALADERMRHEHQLSTELRLEGLSVGEAISFEDYRRCRYEAELARQAVDALFDEYDALLAPSAVGEADPGLNSTGSAVFSNAWSMLHVPCITLPAGVGPNELPLAIQLIGRRGRDEYLLDVAEWVRHRLG
jgi:Asp-tRNA(Asn)/Glu-tRNA(Gln) amidotransferase A subunit family amidase